MEEGRELAPRGGDLTQGRRRHIEVSPDQVWQPGPPPPPPDPVREARESRRSFMAPILMVVLVSAGLLYGLVAIAAALWAWTR